MRFTALFPHKNKYKIYKKSIARFNVLEITDSFSINEKLNYISHYKY